MADTLLEQTRALHEDLERMERKIVDEFKNEPEGHKDRLLQNHRIRGLLDAMQERSAKLRRIYADEDRGRRDEAASLSGVTPAQRMTKFMSLFREVQDYYRRHPTYEFSEGGDIDPLTLITEPRVEFTGEERWGRSFDLHDLHLQFQNAPFGRACDYTTYVQDLSDFSAIPRRLKMSDAYAGYLRQLVSYLESFYARTQPLVNAERNYRKLEEEFGRQWDAGEVDGWEDRGAGVAGDEVEPLVDVDSLEGVGDLLALGPESLKEALDRLGLKTGGTVEQRAERLWMTRGHALSELPKNLFQKGREPAAALTAAQAAKRETRCRATALLEVKAMKLCEVMANVLEATVHYAEKKQVQTFEELEREREDEQRAVEVELKEDSDKEDDIYNPWKIPLGWDGKPLPVWLYKLHGLNIEYKCEICGEASYWGRRAFETHFNEWTHVNGLKALGIRMSKEFYEITSIAEARALWETLKQRNTGGFVPELDEEYEDAEGNVYNKKTFDDLKRQGII